MANWRLQRQSIARKLMEVRTRSGRSAAWLARLVRDQEVEGSNPFAPTIYPFPLWYLRICGTDLFLRICSARSATKPRLRIRNFRHNEAESQQVLPSRPLARLSSKRWLEISLGSTLEHGEIG